MEYLGSGWQFDVYAEGPLVVKRPTSSLAIARRVILNYPQLAVRPVELVRKVREVRRKRGRALHELGLHVVPDHITAGAEVRGTQVHQRRVTTLGAALKSVEDGRSIIDAYIDSILEGWRHGIAETSFNFTVNHGMDDEGRVVIVDIGEVTFDRRVVAGILSHCFWQRAFSTQTLSKPLRLYYLDQMATRVSAVALHDIWRDAPPARPRLDDRPAVRSTRIRTERAAQVRAK